jgi:hypothetical protein
MRHIHTKAFLKPKRNYRKMAMTGPTFQAVWEDSDSTATRMTIHCDDENPDLSRAVRVSWAAYQSRTKNKGLGLFIRHAHFERDHKILHAYKNIDITEHGVDPFVS